MEEKRIAERVKPVDDCIVVHSNKIGSIKDISSGGLYCSCFQDSTCKLGIHKEIDILCGYGKFLVKGIKVKIVESQSDAGRFLTNFEIKKCRLQFVEMADHQASGIETIIEGGCFN